MEGVYPNPVIILAGKIGQPYSKYKSDIYFLVSLKTIVLSQLGQV